MNTIGPVTELLLVINSRIGGEACWKPCESKNGFSKTTLHELEQTGWYGLLQHLLPEIVRTNTERADFMTWSVLPGDHVLHIAFSAVGVDKQTCIDPYFFLSVVNYN